MKPLNLDNSPCSPISSNCVIWQGPNIPCIKLCTGDTITDVVYALAMQLCDIVDAVNISTLDLDCLEITTGTPTNINQLLQILIDKICDTNSIPAPSAFPTRGNSSCPTDCIVPVAACLQTGTQTTMKLLDYVQLIGNTICSILDDITTINNSITNITNRVIALELVPPTPPYILPPITPRCTLSPSIPGGVTAPLELVLGALINDLDHGYCALLGTTGQPSDITIAYNSQTVSGTDGALSDCALTLDQLFSTTWITTPTNLSESFIDLWLTVQDIRDAYKRYNVTAGNTNVIVTTTTTPDSCGPEISFDIKAKSSSVSAGTNITSVTTNVVDLNTEYTVNAKNTTVAAGNNITVATNTTDPANTIYTVSGKEAIVQASLTANNTVTVTPTAGPGLDDTTYSVYSQYGLESVVLATVINATAKPTFIQKNSDGSFTGDIPIRTPGGGITIGEDMDMLVRYNVVTINDTSTSATTIAGGYVPDQTLPFGTYLADQGTVVLNKEGTYQITGALQLKSTNETPPIWQSSGIGSFHLGILSNANNVYTGNSQSLQGPVTYVTSVSPPATATIPGQHTTVSLSATITTRLNSGDQVRLGVFNFSDRIYNGNAYVASDILRFAITRLR